MAIQDPNSQIPPIVERAERIEREALYDLHAAAEAPLADALGLKLREVETALVSLCSEDTSLVLNRVLGLGILKPATLEAIGEARRLYQQAGIERFLVHCCAESEPPELPGWLHANGLKPGRRWIKFVRDGLHPFETAATPRVEPVGREHRDLIADIVADAFDMTQAAGQLVAGLAGRPGWRLYMSFDGDEPLGVGAFYFEGDDAWFDWDATRPEARGRGSQQALLAQRIDEARALGCTTVYTATPEPGADEIQPAYHNLLKAGFQRAYPRDNFMPA